MFYGRIIQEIFDSSESYFFIRSCKNIGATVNAIFTNPIFAYIENFARPHGALGGQTPYERLKQKKKLTV